MQILSPNVATRRLCHLYGFSTLGQKFEWMRSNPLVCLEIDERTSHPQWMTVVVSGRYEELPDTPEFRPERVQAHEVLQKRVMWWEPAYVATEHREQLTPILYRIYIKQITGCATRSTASVTSRTGRSRRSR